MAETITLSLSKQDAKDLEDNQDWSPSKIFRSAMRMQRARDEFFEIYDIWDFVLALREHKDKIMLLQKEIERRNERIESLSDVLAQKEIAERRVRKVEQAFDRTGTEIHQA